MHQVSDPQGLTPQRPVLHLSGPKLRAAFERLIRAAEPLGGIERFAEAVKLKSEVFQDRLGDGKAATLAAREFDEIVPLMATVRRRIAPLIDGQRLADDARRDRRPARPRARHDDRRQRIAAFESTCAIAARFAASSASAERRRERQRPLPPRPRGRAPAQHASPSTIR